MHFREGARMSGSEIIIGGVVAPRAEPPGITAGEAVARREQPRPKPEGGELGYLHAERGVPVACSWDELADACRSGTALLAWSPETAQMVAPREVPGLAAAVLQADVAEAGAWRLRTLIALALLATLALFFPYVWVLPAFAALFAWRANLSVREAEARTQDDLAWTVADPESVPVHVPTPYNTAIASAIGVAALAQMAVLGREWLDGMWIPDPPDGDWLRLLGDPLLHTDPFALLVSGVVLGGLGAALEKEAPRAYVPLSFVAGALAAVVADLLLPGSLPPGPLGGLLGMAGFYAVLATRHAPLDRTLPQWLRSPLTVVSGAAALLAFAFSMAPLGGAGLLAGIALGKACIPRAEALAAEDSADGAAWTEWMGLGALGLIWLSALAAIASLVIG